MPTGELHMLQPKKPFFAVLLTFCLSLFLFCGTAGAVHPEEKSEIENLKNRIEALEAEKDGPEDDADFDLGRINRYLTLHGLLEVEAFYAKPDEGEEESDLTLATAELAIEATLNQMVGGHLTLLYEEEEDAEDDLNVDEAVISLRSAGHVFNQTPALHFGRMYVPFGSFNSYMVSDSLTLELGETRNTAALFALEGDFWSLALGTFNGDVDAAGDNDNLDSWVAALQFSLGENLAFGGSYLSDLAESDIGLVQDASLYTESVPAASAFVSGRYGQFGFEAEYLAALEDFDADVVLIGEDLTGDQPQSYNLELAWMISERMQAAGRYEKAKDFLEDMQRFGGTISYGLFGHMVVALEYLRTETDTQDSDTLTAQLALEF